MKNKMVYPEAFQVRRDETTLSFSLQDADLLSDAGIDRYQCAKALASGDLPGLCRVEYTDFMNRVRPPLPPRFEANPGDAAYGHLHCCTDPANELQREVLARAATEHGIVREMKRATKSKQ